MSRTSHVDRLLQDAARERQASLDARVDLAPQVARALAARRRPQRARRRPLAVPLLGTALVGGLLLALLLRAPAPPSAEHPEHPEHPAPTAAAATSPRRGPVLRWPSLAAWLEDAREPLRRELSGVASDSRHLLSALERRMPRPLALRFERR